jgi:hypothetical protein
LKMSNSIFIILFAYILLWDKEYLLMVTYGDFPAQNL